MYSFSYFAEGYFERNSKFRTSQDISDGADSMVDSEQSSLVSSNASLSDPTIESLNKINRSTHEDLLQQSREFQDCSVSESPYLSEHSSDIRE